MLSFQNLVQTLERRFYNSTDHEEKFLLLSLLQIYYPIIQKELTTNFEVKQSKINLLKLKSECLHRRTVPEKNSKFIRRCLDCEGSVFV